MSADAPAFYTEATTPLSPQPVYPPEPSNIPVLRNQIDPIFNTMSANAGKEAPSDLTTSLSTGVISMDDATTDAAEDASFSDPYDDDEDNDGDVQHKDDVSNRPAQEAEIDDDYAMTFDSDGEPEDIADRQNETDQQNDQIQSHSQAIPAIESASSITTEVLPAATSTNPNDSAFTTSITSPNPASTSNNAPIFATSTTLPALSKPVSPLPPAHSYEDIASGEVDIQQLLDNITATAELNASQAAPATPGSATSTFTPSAIGLPSHSSLPPRPQAAQNPPPHQTFASQENARKFPAGHVSLPPQPFGVFRPVGAPGTFAAPGAPGTSADARNSLPPPPSASFIPPPAHVAPQAFPTSQYAHPPRLQATERPKMSQNIDDSDPGEIQWGPAVQKLYDEFLADERHYVSEGTWDKFPVGSRLFVGNLPTEKVTKRDMFNTFHKYGRLAQVSIKQAYGFIQFLESTSCHRALDREQGQEIRGRRMHLEVAKPQKNTRQAGPVAAAPVTSRRSRSPDYVRGLDRGVPRGGSQVARGGYDRYESRPVNDLQHGDFRGQKLVRDDYRPGRSLTPPQVAGFKRRDGYAPNSGRDYYDGRGRDRSRSRSPIKWRDNGRYRDRSPSPVGRNSYGEAEPPQRDARDVPEVQIVLIDELDRGFVTWVEGEFRAKSIKTDVMIMSPRLSLAAIIRQQIVEGVLAVTQLSRRSQDTSKIPLQVFDRKGGANNVRFDEYQDLEPKIAAELVIRAKQAQGPPPQTYIQPQFIPPHAYQAPPPVAAAPNLASLVGTLDNASLQQLLGTLNASGQQQQAAAQANSSIDLAGILGGLSQQIQQQNQQQNYSAPPAQNNNYNAMTSTQSLASLLGNGQGQPQQQSAQQVQDIMAQLARFRQ